MIENDSQQLFVVNGDLVESLLRGDKGSVDPNKAAIEASDGLARGVALADHGHIDQAIRALEEAFARGENPVEIQTALGHLRFEQENWSAAEAHYSKAMQLEPMHPTVHYNLALCLQRQSKFQAALEAFEAALAVDPKRWQAHFGRGWCLLKLEQPEPALVALQAAEKDILHGYEDSGPRIQFGKAVALHMLGRMEDALELYKSLLPQMPGSVELLSNLVTMYHVRGDASQVFEFAERLLRIQPKSATALQAVTAAALSRGDFPARILRSVP